MKCGITIKTNTTIIINSEMTINMIKGLITNIKNNQLIMITHIDMNIHILVSLTTSNIIQIRIFLRTNLNNFTIKIMKIIMLQDRFLIQIN